MALAQPMLKLSFGPTWKPGSHFQMAHQFTITTPIPKEVLASPHHCRSITWGDTSGIWFRRFWIRKWTQKRSAAKGVGTQSLVHGDLKDDRNAAMFCRKGQVRGKCKIGALACHAGSLLCKKRMRHLVRSSSWAAWEFGSRPLCDELDPSQSWCSIALWRMLWTNIFHFLLIYYHKARSGTELGHGTQNEVTMQTQHRTASHSITLPCSTTAWYSSTMTRRTSHAQTL